MSDFQPPPTYALPILVDERSGKAQFNPIWLKWFVDLAAVLNAAGGTSINHNSLEGLQGGQNSEFYHLTAGEHTAIAGTKGANLVLAGPTSGAAAQPTFRSLVSSDLPAGTGTVTSVSGTGTVNGITLTGTVTTSGSLTLGGALSGVSLTSQVTGILPLVNGGLGSSLTDPNADRILFWDDSAGAVDWLTVGSGLTLTGTTLTATGTGGTVTSVGVSGSNGIGVSGSPITGSGTITLSLGAITPSSVAASGTVTGSNLSGTNTGDQTITLTGDVTGSGTGSFTATIANQAVTYAKMQNVSAASRLLGRGSAAGAGSPEEISLGSGLSLSGTTLSATGTGGTVTSVGVAVPTGLSVSGSPVTTSGTITISYAAGYSIPTDASQTNWNTAYSQTRQWDGGATGLVAATGRTSLGGTTVGQNFFTLTNPSAITFPRINADNTVSALDAASFRTAIGAGTGSGSVTSVGLAAPTGLTVSGSPVTGAGTLTLSFTAGYSIPTTASQTNWDTAFSQTRQWDGGATGLVAATGRTSLGGTTVGQNLFTLTNPSAITFPRFNADNTVSALDAASFRTAIGAGTGSGTVTSVAASAGAGISISGSPITSSGTLTITNTDLGSSQNIFKNIAVSGQSDIVADSNNDTLTFAAGSGITLTTNATTDTLTVTNAGVTSITGTASQITASASTGGVTLSLPSTINVNTSGSAATLTTARAITATGDISWTVNFDGSAAVSAAATIATAAVNVQKVSPDVLAFAAAHG